MLWIRLFLQFCESVFKPPVKSQDEITKINYRVWLTDLDPFLHMNNSKYLTYTELARLDLSLRTGLFKACKKNKWITPIAALDIQFFRPLKLFQKFTLTTEIVHFSGKSLFMENRFERKGKLVAKQLVRCVVLSKKGTLPMKEVADAIGFEYQETELPENLSLWSEMLGKSLRKQ